MGAVEKQVGKNDEVKTFHILYRTLNKNLATDSPCGRISSKVFSAACLNASSSFSA